MLSDLRKIQGMSSPVAFSLGEDASGQTHTKLSKGIVGSKWQWFVEEVDFNTLHFIGEKI